jgi:hypothetical protein
MLVGQLNPLMLVTNAWSPVLLRPKFWNLKASGEPGT